MSKRVNQQVKDMISDAFFIYLFLFFDVSLTKYSNLKITNKIDKINKKVYIKKYRNKINLM